VHKFGAALGDEVRAVFFPQTLHVGGARSKPWKTGTIEREAAQTMIVRHSPGSRRLTLGAHKAYDVREFVDCTRVAAANGMPPRS
jgi:hypothetical protein